MPKRALKQHIATLQGNKCDLSGVALADEPALNDTDRRTPKVDGGNYTLPNTRVVEPQAHMVRHDTLRQRELMIDQLKTYVDDRLQVMKLRNKVANQVLAYERRTDRQNSTTLAWLQGELKRYEEVYADRTWVVETAIGLLRPHDTLIDTALNVKYLGPLTVAMLSVYIDLAGRYPALNGDGKPHPRAGQEKCGSVSAIWKYAGLHVPSHERYEKGKAGGGNVILRTALWNSALCMVRGRDSAYRVIYDQTKQKLENSEKVVKTRNTQGHLVEARWRDVKPSHRHGSALRVVMKHILSDYWMVGRTLAGLPARNLYVEEQLGHEHIFKPEDRGWVYPKPE